MASASAHFGNAASQQMSLGSLADVTGEFNAGSYKIHHRDTNALLSVKLSANTAFYAQPGSMVAMSPEITLKG
ncbi:unnamed protein product, partial [Rotaria sp. Silwood1]